MRWARTLRERRTVGFRRIRRVNQRCLPCLPCVQQGRFTRCRHLVGFRRRRCDCGFRLTRPWRCKWPICFQRPGRGWLLRGLGSGQFTSECRAPFVPCFCQDHVAGTRRAVKNVANRLMMTMNQPYRGCAGLDDDRTMRCKVCNLTFHCKPVPSAKKAASTCAGPGSRLEPCRATQGGG